MTGILWRIIIAVVCVLLVFALIGPVSAEIGFNISGNFMQIIKICVAGIALLYILRGSGPNWPANA